MGKLLSLLARDDSNCCGPQQYDVFLDFENAVPSDSERDVFDYVQKVLDTSSDILEELECYRGAEKEIREAIASPKEENAQNSAREALTPLVDKLRRYYEFSNELKTSVQMLFERLCGGGLSPTQHLETQQALVKQLAELLEFVLKFDELKLRTPAIQNDFSYYRRSVMRIRMEGNNEDAPISSDLANHMSLFYANATPMLKVLSEATYKFCEDNSHILVGQLTETIGTMAKVCLRMLENPKLLVQFEREETQLFVLRIMVGLVILYDHVHPEGAFVRSAQVDVKGCIKFLQAQPPDKGEPLLDALRYTTKHLNETNTPRTIKSMLST